MARFIKRLIDITIATLFLLIFALPMAVIAISVLIFLGRPIFFSQPRAGYKGRIFTIRKFRTMKEARDKNGDPLTDAERLSIFGKMLRATSLDELPELWNILVGEMSLVGPRPLLAEYLPLYSSEQARRHNVHPGLTGWAQVNGRNAISWDERFKLDLWYVDNWSLWLDLKILLMTAINIFKTSNISNQGHATMPKFEGARSDGQSNDSKTVVANSK